MAVTNIVMKADSDSARFAADIFAKEIRNRFTFSGEGKAFEITFITDGNMSTDDYCVKHLAGEIVFTACGIRGFLFAVGLFLRKTQVCDGGFSFVCDLSGVYSPAKEVRGHQLGYRDLNNTYDRWSIEDFKRYYLDLMYFGANTVEHIPYAKGYPDKKDFMLYDELDLLRSASAEADKLNLDVSVWAPNCEDSFEKAVENRQQLFSLTPRLDYLFPPGSDPGDLEVPELFKWLKKFSADMRLIHPQAKLTPSAQTPSSTSSWGDMFIAEMQKNPDYIDAVVQGPNRAFTTDELRRKLPARYPVRFYPDITHNVRCETPVHFDRDDWHYSWTTALSRECINPRPEEYRRFHYLQSPYTNGSVTYSEGVNDDINKAVWCALEYDPDLSVREILTDYARCFMPGADAEKVADGIQGLENNWLTAPENNPGVEYTCLIWREIGEHNPKLKDNWRYVSCLFRAVCDLFIRKKVLFELPLVKKAEMLLSRGAINEAISVLDINSYPADISALREEIETLAGRLYELIGIQLSVEKFNAHSWERGAVLDTIDLPVTDRQYLLNMARKAQTAEDRQSFIEALVNHTKTEPGEYYFSFALHGLSFLGENQTPDFYMNYQGDRPNVNTGTLPMCLTKVFDHFSLRLRTGGLTMGSDYSLIVTYLDTPDGQSKSHRVAVNGHTVYEGAQFGGRINKEIGAVLPDRFVAVEYDIPADYIENGCVYLEITEPTVGFKVAEIRFKERK